MQRATCVLNDQSVFLKRAVKPTIRAFFAVRGDLVMDTETRNRLSLASIGLALCICATAPAKADQAAPTTEESGGIEEIVVTARKTAESLQTTPVAVSAFTSASLAQQ